MSLTTAWHAYYSVFFAHIKARAKRKDLCVLSSSHFNRSRLNVALDSAKVFWSCSCKRLMSVEEGSKLLAVSTLILTPSGGAAAGEPGSTKESSQQR